MRSAPTRRRDYPRVCGGTRTLAVCALRTSGLSPRVRGNLHRAGLPILDVGTIPACAGEPGRCRRPDPAARDYPRVCGGTRSRPISRSRVLGLSPRVRGNLDTLDRRKRLEGTIPACAGEPCPGAGNRVLCGDYPRVCGGTRIGQSRPRTPQGLSPRVRGNPVMLSSWIIGVGTIPACAGEPPTGNTPSGPAWDYPRVCGGTPLGLRWLASCRGLSPRVRGNRVCPNDEANRHGTIPACAGEPSTSIHVFRESEDYPRVCGGTLGDRSPMHLALGLSPRVRGNPPMRSTSAAPTGTIPACAGEPDDRQRLADKSGDYPRVCGGTTCRTWSGASGAGLSPRVRGNRPARLG